AALFHLVYLQQWLADAPCPPYLRAWVSFVGLFWMTAPLAWIYAVPYERFLSAAGAVKARLWSLGLVSLWRVVLMMRVLQVVLGYGAIRAAFVVLLFADVVAMLAIHWTTPRDRSVGLPLLTGMGAIMPVSRTDVRLLRATGNVVGGLGCITLPVWLIGAVLTATLSPLPAKWTAIAGADIQPLAGLGVVAIGSVLGWFPILAVTQPKQRLRTRIEDLFRAGRVKEALTEMSSHLPQDFPTNWEPPPAGRFDHEEGNTSLLGVFDVMSRERPAPWILAAYMAQLEEYLGEALWYWLDDESLLGTAALLDQLPEGARLARIAADAIDKLTDQVDDLHYSQAFKESFLPTPGQQRAEAIERIQLLAAKRGTKR
ncbi:MAG TPA: hypothetical protein VG125_21785, partial [Pirellulales bacterium]|nr:hypothetical protein [Pirellulales bacterium]